MNHQNKYTYIWCANCKEYKLHQAHGLCHACYNRIIWGNNPKRKEYHREYYLQHKEEAIKKATLWKKENLGKVRQSNKKYSKEHKEQILEIGRKWRQTPNGKFSTRRRNFSKRQGNELFKEDIKKAVLTNWLQAGIHLCEKCGAFCGDINSPLYHLDHIIPISKGGFNNFDNLQVLCASCNQEKSSKIADYRNFISLREVNA